MGSARAAAARGLRSAPRLTLGRAPRRTEPGLPPGSVGAGPGPGCEGPRRLARPRRGLLDPDAAGEASRRAPSRGAGVPGLAGRAQARAAGRRRADSGALRARRGSHSDEIPVPGQRHQPASAFLLPSQIETEGGGREVGKKKKKSNQRGREGGREKPRRWPARPPRRYFSVPPRPRAGSPPAERPRSRSSRWAGASDPPRKTRIDQTRKEFFSTANEQEARLPALQQIRRERKENAKSRFLSTSAPPTPVLSKK